MAATEPVTEIDQIDDLEFERRTLAAIRQELGLGGLARFLMTNRSGKGDYTRERQLRQDAMTLEEKEQEMAKLIARLTPPDDGKLFISPSRTKPGPTG